MRRMGLMSYALIALGAANVACGRMQARRLESCTALN